MTHSNTNTGDAKMINLTKPAREYSSDERRTIYTQLVKDIKSGLTPAGGRLSGAQVAYAKGQAWKVMKKAGF